VQNEGGGLEENAFHFVYGTVVKKEWFCGCLTKTSYTIIQICLTQMGLERNISL
jgi:hypothetical protein